MSTVSDVADIGSFAVSIIQLVVDVIGMEQTKASLSLVEAQAANAAADAAEDAKFGPAQK